MNEIEELRQELKQTQLAYQMAAQMSEFKAGFLARTSHELRSPLSSMIGLHQLILSDLCESPEEQKEFISQAYHSALKLMKLIDEIVAVSKTEYGSNPLDIESLQLTEIFANIERLTHLQAANRNLTLEITTPNSSLWVRADRSRLIQLIVNLIDSGISVMKEGTIKVAADSKSDEVEIEIDLECSATIWQESADQQLENAVPPNPHSSLEEIRHFLQKISLSPYMKLLLSQTLLETMGGRLDFFNLSAQNNNQPLTRFVLVCQPGS